MKEHFLKELLIQNERLVYTKSLKHLSGEMRL